MGIRKVESLALLASLVWMGACQQGMEAPAGEGGGMEMEMEMEHSAHSGDTVPEHGEEHADHDPRHGGIFFMALDYIHHLEGTLTPPGLVRIYLYNQRTEPLSREKLAQARGTLHWGPFPDPPAMEMTVSQEAACLEVELDKEVTFPLELTALIYLPDRKPDAEPELFSFTFEGYSEGGAQQGHAH